MGKEPFKALRDKLQKYGQKELGIKDSKTGITVSGRKRNHILGDKFQYEERDINDIVTEYMLHASPSMNKKEQLQYAKDLIADFNKANIPKARIVEALMYSLKWGKTKAKDMVYGVGRKRPSKSRKKSKMVKEAKKEVVYKEYTKLDHLNAVNNWINPLDKEPPTLSTEEQSILLEIRDVIHKTYPIYMEYSNFEHISAICNWLNVESEGRVPEINDTEQTHLLVLKNVLNKLFKELE